MGILIWHRTEVEWEWIQYPCDLDIWSLKSKVILATPIGSAFQLFTHKGWVTHICISKLTIIGSDNGLSPGRLHVIIWTNAGIFSIWTCGTNFSEILSEILTFSFKKMHLKMSSAKLLQFCLGPNMLTFIVMQFTPLARGQHILKVPSHVSNENVRYDLWKWICTPLTSFFCFTFGDKCITVPSCIMFIHLVHLINWIPQGTEKCIVITRPSWLFW